MMTAHPRRFPQMLVMSRRGVHGGNTPVRIGRLLSSILVGTILVIAQPSSWNGDPLLGGHQHDLQPSRPLVYVYAPFAASTMKTPRQGRLSFLPRGFAQTKPSDGHRLPECPSFGLTDCAPGILGLVEPYRAPQDQSANNRAQDER